MLKNKLEKKYIHAYRKLKSAIVSGAYRKGTKLPGKRVLANQEGISVITMEHALAILEEEGYIEARMRSGFYVLYEPDSLFGDHSEEIHSFKGEREMGTVTSKETLPPCIYTRAVRRILSTHGDLLAPKPPGKGMVLLREALARYLHRSRGMKVSIEQIVIGGGSEYLYTLLVQLLGREKTYAVEFPSYEKIASIYRANAVKIEYLRMGKEGITSAALAASKADVLHITPYHSYPSHVTASVNKRHAYINWAKTHGAWIIEDDFESEYTLSTKAEDTLFSMDPQRVIYVNTFTRTIGPALRMSYMVLPKEMVHVFDKQLSFYASTVSALLQLTIAELLDDGAFERHINRIRRQRRKFWQATEQGDGLCRQPRVYNRSMGKEKRL